MRIFGLDISTQTIGICIIDFTSHSNLILLDHYKPIKNQHKDLDHDFLNMVSLAKHHILNLIDQYKPDRVSVENYIKFLKGGSGAATIIPLAILNRSICLAVKENYPHIPLDIFNVISIRSTIRKQAKLSKLPKKEDLPPLLEDLLQIKVPILTKVIKKNNKIKILPETYDQSDALAVAYHSYIKKS